MAGKLRYWKERNGRYSVRVVVPLALRPYLDGKTEIEVQLGPDKREAIRRHAAAVAGIQHQLAVAKERLAAPAPTPRPASRYPLPSDQLAALQYRSLIALDSEARSSDVRFAQQDFDPFHAQELRDGLAGRLSDDDLDRLVGYRIERFRFIGYTNAVKGSPEWRDLAMKLCVSEHEALARHVERNEGDFNGRPTHPVLASIGDATEPPTPKVTFDSIIEAEEKRRARGRGAKPFAATTVKKYKMPAASFAKFRQSDDASTVTAEEAKNWMEAMQDEGKHGNRTIKMSVQNVRTVLKWGRDHDPKGFLPGGNPLSGMTLPGYTTAPSYLKAFTLPEAKMVLAAARREELPMFRWIPWLCAYSGMRIGEASTLTKEDFFKHGERWLWRVTTIGGKSLKTESSERRIPVHLALVDEGLIEFIETAPSGLLFRGKTKDQVTIQPRVSTWIRGIIPFKDPPRLDAQPWMAASIRGFLSA